MSISRRRRGGPFWWVAVVVCALTVVFAGWRIGVNRAAEPPEATRLWMPPPASSAALPSSAAAAPSRPGSDGAAEQPRWSGRAAAAPPTTAGVPRRLEIPRLGLEMPIVTSTVAAGQMALPAHPTQIGWYAFGPSPFDQTGAAVLAGHVDSRKYGTGPLAGLRLLRPGDAVVVIGDTRRSEFRITAVQLVGKQSSALAAAFDRSGPGRLEIITCGGSYLPNEGGYQRNVVVSAVPR